MAPHFSADVSLLLTEVNQITVDTLFRANRLLDQVRNMKEQKLKIHKIDLGKLVLVSWVDAANQNRIGGGSTQGVVIGAASKELLTGSRHLLKSRSQRGDGSSARRRLAVFL